jgi:hypothetical protein
MTACVRRQRPRNSGTKTLQSALLIKTGISLIRDWLGFGSYRHRLVDFSTFSVTSRHPLMGQKYRHESRPKRTLLLAEPVHQHVDERANLRAQMPAGGIERIDFEALGR